ncbi:hypothetical protein RHMOL_Rhmol09G0173400 [Rhododendron molle]|uniref:Uncharacterized protein n=1 Tax=Rhododendron molle TaxID=49168 RepID=A0ACC0MEJ6_RHOML|nr:hypothetical protein RHMOL_Rhmol09G0173400 [Rhododendron molle]
MDVSTAIIRRSNYYGDKYRSVLYIRVGSLQPWRKEDVNFRSWPSWLFATHYKQTQSYRDRCFEDANKLASIFNEKLETKLKELSGKLKGSTFVTARTFHLIKDIVENPFDYGRWVILDLKKQDGRVVQLKKTGRDYAKNLKYTLRVTGDDGETPAGGPVILMRSNSEGIVFVRGALLLPK